MLMGRTGKEGGSQQSSDIQQGCLAGELCVGILGTAWCIQNGGGYRGRGDGPHAGGGCRGDGEPPPGPVSGSSV